MKLMFDSSTSKAVVRLFYLSLLDAPALRRVSGSSAALRAKDQYVAGRTPEKHLRYSRRSGLLLLLFVATGTAYGDKVDDYIKTQMHRRHIAGLSLAVVK